MPLEPKPPGQIVKLYHAHRHGQHIEMRRFALEAAVSSRRLAPSQGELQHGQEKPPLCQVTQGSSAVDRLLSAAWGRLDTGVRVAPQ